MRILALLLCFIGTTAACQSLGDFEKDFEKAARPGFGEEQLNAMFGEYGPRIAAVRG